MSGWKLWTSVASGVLSVGGGSTYYYWNRTQAVDSSQVAAANPEDVSPHAVPPQPIPDSFEEPTSPQFATAASYNEPAPGAAPRAFPSRPPRGMIVRGNDGQSEFSPRPAFGAPPNSIPPSSYPPSDLPVTDPSDSPAAVPAGRYRSTFSDQATQPETRAANDGAPGDSSRQEPQQQEGQLDSSDREAQPPSATTAAESPAGPQTSNDAPAEAPRTFLEAPPASPATTPETSRETNPETSPHSAPVAPKAPRRSFGSQSTEISPRDTGLISNAPGERRLEGLQAPSLTIERSAPEEIQVGKLTKFVIKVRNVGQVPAQGVTVSDQVPNGTRFVGASPETSPSAKGTLLWEVGALQSGEEAVLTVELMPEAEGEIGSVAEVTFRAQAAVRTIATKPLLKVEQAGPAKALIGEDVSFQITVSNPGTGVATGVVVEVDVPEGLAHDGGREIMTDPFDLRPNETRSFDLILRAVQAGLVPNLVRAVGTGTLAAEHRSQLEIVSPQLQVNTVGPTRRFLDRPVRYQIVVSNPGTAPATEIELQAHLPRGLKFTAADKKGRYNQNTHAVTWSLEALPAGEQGVVELTAIPTATGEQKLHIEGRAALGLEHQQEHTTVVEDITNLNFTVSNESVPIEVGSETTYQIRVANSGTKAAQNVRLAVQVPAGLEIVDSDGPTKIQKQGDQLVMQAISQLGQGEEAVYRLVAKGTRAGDHVLRVQLLCDEFTTPATKEEITKVYSDK